MEDKDHDLLIRLDSQLSGLTSQVATMASATAASTTRIELKVDTINGRVSKHDVAILELQSRPNMENMYADYELNRDGRKEESRRIDVLWSDRKVVLSLLAVFAIVQPIVIILIQRFWN